jgi:oligogalacturonide lyase
MTRRELITLFPLATLDIASRPAAFQAGRPQSKKAQKALPTLGDFFPYADPSTETTVVRLTNPGFTSLIPPSQNRHVSSESRFLVYSSDKSGVMSPFHLDLRTAVARQLAVGEGYVPSSLSIDWQEKRALFLMAKRLMRVSVDKLKVEAMADEIDGFHINAPSNEIVVLRQGRLQRLGVNAAAPLADQVADRGLVSPNGAWCCYLRREGSRDGIEEQSLWAVAMSGTGKPVRLVAGPISNPCWNPDSQTVLFLRQTMNGDALIAELKEAALDGSGDRQVLRSNQFAAFSPNGDGSVLVGASRSRAQPHVIITLRSSRRDMTLCEHRATHPEAVQPVFSPNSRRVYFQSDRDGRPALYAVNVESLVEPTDQKATFG